MNLQNISDIQFYINTLEIQFSTLETELRQLVENDKRTNDKIKFMMNITGIRFCCDKIDFSCVRKCMTKMCMTFLCDNCATKLKNGTIVCMYHNTD